MLLENFRVLRVPQVSTALVLFVVLNMGCTGSGTSAFTANTIAASSTSSSSVSRSWSTPQVIDLGSGSSSYATNHNVERTGTAYRFPMAVFNDAVKNFNVVMNRASSNAAPSTVLGYIMGPSNFNTDAWVTSLGNFTQVDVGTSRDSMRPLAAVDSNGNTIVVMFAEIAAGTDRERPLAVRRTAGSSYWSTPTDISTTVLSDSNDNPIRPYSTAMSVDAYNNTVVVWCQDTDNDVSSAFFNEHRPYSGWRWSNTAGDSNARIWNDGNACTANGMDVGFDSSGTGYGVFSTSANIVMRRWSGDNWSGSAWTLGGVSGTVAMPKLYVAPNGQTSVFFYNTYTAATSGELNLSTGSGTTFGSATRFDSSVGTGTVYAGDTVDVIAPILAYKGSKAVLLFIKSNGTTRRLWVSLYQGGVSWSTPTALDSGVGDVTWADASINSAGQIAVVFSSIQTADASTEHVYGNIYTSDTWQGNTRLDTLSIFSSGTSVNYGEYRPSVSIDSEGNAVATFSIIISSVRRGVAVVYR